MPHLEMRELFLFNVIFPVKYAIQGLIPLNIFLIDPKIKVDIKGETWNKGSRLSNGKKSDYGILQSLQQ